MGDGVHSRISRPTRNMIQLKKKEVILAKAGRYAEAAKVQATIENLHDRQRASSLEGSDCKLGASFAHRQHAELQLFQAKLQSKREKLAVTRKVELDQLLQQQHAAKLKMESDYKRVERIIGTQHDSPA